MPRGLRSTLLALPPLLAATAVAAAPLSIPIGAVNSLTGRLAAQGTAIHRGILLAVEEANAGGGVGGRPVRLLVQDDEGRPERALAPAVTAGFCGTLREVAEEGITILLVGQHVRRILKMAGRAYLLDAGRIVEEGPGPVLLQAPGVRKALLGA